LNSIDHTRPEDLELFALGVLSDEEEAALAEHLSGCQECRLKLAEARGHVSLLAFAAKQRRPAGTVKAELMARIRVSREAEEYYAWPTKEEVLPGPRSASRSTPELKRNRWTWALLAAAAVLALISFGLSRQNRRIAAELQRQRDAADQLIRDQEQVEKLVRVLVAPDTLTVKLAATQKGVNASGVVKFNSKAGVVLYTADLAPLPPNQSYQMWLVPVSGASVSAGLLGPGGHAWGSMWTGEVPANIQVKAFALTIEPVGGTLQPTGPKILLGAT
jgi:anti-sigma-K factor RskA